MSRSCREQEAGAGSAFRHGPGLQSFKTDEGKARGAGRDRSRVAADHWRASRDETT
jgi:hypothetical protein